MINVEHVNFPHFNELEWNAVRKMADSMSGRAVAAILTLNPDEQLKAIRNYMVNEEVSLHQRIGELVASGNFAMEAPQRVESRKFGTFKLKISPYYGDENENLLRWILEVETGMKAANIVDEELKVAYGMSNLRGKAKEWAFSKKLVQQDCFPNWKSFVDKLRLAFQPPKCEVRMRAEFLALRQGKRSLHAYIQEVRQIVANLMHKPVDDTTQVSVFLKGLNPGAVRTQLYRVYPSTLDEAMNMALEEDFSERQANYDTPKRSRFNPSSSSRSGSYSMTDLPMEICSIRPSNKRDNNSRNGLNKSKSICFRCGEYGHMSAACRATDPNPALVKARRYPKSKSNDLKAASVEAIKSLGQPENGNHQ
jgi:hypothetical protein